MFRRALALAVCLTPGLAGCGPAAQDDAPPPAESVSEPGHVMEIVARGLTFEAPAEVGSGWVTLRLVNESDMVHFALVQKLPDGVDMARQQAEVAPVFQRGMDRIAAGDMEGAMAAFGELPEWFGGVVMMGGPGLTAAGRTSEATVQLEPGTYMLECYVKTGGTFHSVNPAPGEFGMVHQFTVLPDDAGGTEPSADLSVTLSANGLEMDGGLTAGGARTVAVTFADQSPHQNFVGHDLHLVRLDGDGAEAAVAAWMDWSTPGGLETPAPAEWLGGLNELPAGAKGYFTVPALEAGRYALVSEVNDPAGKGLMVPLEVR